MQDYKKTITSLDVWKAIRASHAGELRVFSSYSAPCGDQYGDPSKGKMFTSYGFDGHDFPVMEAETVWDISAEQPDARNNETTKYWLCSGIKETDE